MSIMSHIFYYYMLYLFAIYYYGEQYFSAYICFSDHKLCSFEAHWLQLLRLNIIGGRITGTIAWVMLSTICLSLSRDELRTISVPKCASHLVQLLCVVCFLSRFFVVFFLLAFFLQWGVCDE